MPMKPHPITVPALEYLGRAQRPWLRALDPTENDVVALDRDDDHHVARDDCLDYLTLPGSTRDPASDAD